MDESQKNRLKALDDKLKEIEARKAKKSNELGAAAKVNNMGLAYRMVVDLVAGIVFGVVVGLAIDAVFKTEPWGLIVMVLLGLAAGIRIMLQSAKSFEADQKRQEEEEKNG